MAGRVSRAEKLSMIALAFSLCAAGLATTFIPLVHAQSIVSVTIAGYAFSPDNITVVIGVNNTVRWTNAQAGVQHTVTSDDGSWGSTALSNGQSYTHTFTTSGSFGYHCSIHGYMKGTINVLSSGPTSTTTTNSTTASSSTTGSQSSTTTTGSAISTASSSSSASGSGGGVPEFPYSMVAVATISVLVVASYLFTRRSGMAGRLGPPKR